MNRQTITQGRSFQLAPSDDSSSLIPRSGSRSQTSTLNTGPSEQLSRWQALNTETMSQRSTIQVKAKGSKRVLCLDGGGIRGISTLLILQRIMEEIRDLCGLSETPRPCEYFSLIGGTSTGGIIAIMLGPLKMTVAQCLKSYKAMAARAFTPIDQGTWSSWILRLPGRPEGAFSGEELAEAIKDIVQEYKGDRGALFADTDCCKTVVLAVTKADVGAPPTKFRTYKIGDDLKECEIWEVARATSAATTFFPSISCGLQDIEYIDAGFGHNNPTEVLFSEAQDEFDGEGCDCVLSIGTGLDGVIPVENSRISILKALKRMASVSEAVHRRIAKALPEEVYFRFNVTRGLDDITLSDWEQRSKISAHTMNYLQDVHVERAIRKCARILSGSQGNDVYSPMYDFSAGGGMILSKESIRNQLIVAWAFNIHKQLPLHVNLSEPVILFTATGECLPIFTEFIASLEAFKHIIEDYTRDKLDKKYRVHGTTKIRNEEFVIQDLEKNLRFDIRKQRWDYVMKPGTRRHMSIKFSETGVGQTSCPHCGSESPTTSGPTICQECDLSYGRIIEVDEDEEGHHVNYANTQRLRPNALGSVRRKTPKPEPDLRLAFKRITLTSNFHEPFSEFAGRAAGYIETVRLEKAKKNREIKAYELEKFADSFKLNTPVPSDLVSIIAKDSAKLGEIPEKAERT